MGSNLELFSALVGTGLPAVVAAVNRTAWPSEAKAFVALLLSILAGAGTAWFSGQFDPTDVVRSILIVFTMAVVTYNTFWRTSGIAGQIERATG